MRAGGGYLPALLQLLEGLRQHGVSLQACHGQSQARARHKLAVRIGERRSQHTGVHRDDAAQQRLRSRAVGPLQLPGQLLQLGDAPLAVDSGDEVLGLGELAAKVNPVVPHGVQYADRGVVPRGVEVPEIQDLNVCPGQ